VGFNFRVTSSDASLGLGSITALTGFELNQTDASFQSVTGISASIQTQDYNALGSNNQQLKLPGKVTFSDLELKRGIVKKGSNIGEWCNKFLTNDQLFYYVSRKTINVFLLDNNSDDILMTWTFFNCYPIEINIDPFDAMNGAYAIETMKLTYSHFKKN
jgi:phage tail-like protein